MSSLKQEWFATCVPVYGKKGRSAGRAEQLSEAARSHGLHADSQIRDQMKASAPGEQRAAFPPCSASAPTLCACKLRSVSYTQDNAWPSQRPPAVYAFEADRVQLLTGGITIFLKTDAKMSAALSESRSGIRASFRNESAKNAFTSSTIFSV